MEAWGGSSPLESKGLSINIKDDGESHTMEGKIKKEPLKEI